MPGKTWTIYAGDVSGGSFRENLIGCCVTENAAGTAYEFTEPNINNVLSTVTGSAFPTGAFNFPEFTYHGLTWQISVTSLSPNEVQGSWLAGIDRSEGILPEPGNWTAQAGSGASDDEPKTASSTPHDSANVTNLPGTSDRVNQTNMKEN